MLWLLLLILSVIGAWYVTPWLWIAVAVVILWKMGEPSKREKKPAKGANKSSSEPFRFPACNSDDSSIVKVGDRTRYKDPMGHWGDLEADEKREYTMSDFEQDFDAYDIELQIEPFYSALRRMPDEYVQPLDTLRNNSKLIRDLVSAFEHGDFVLADAPTHATMIEHGYLETRYPPDLNEYVAHIKHDRMKQACRKAGIQSAQKKADTFQRLSEASALNELPQPAYITDKFDHWLANLASIYLKDVRRTAERHHSLYVPPAIEAACEELDEIRNLQMTGKLIEKAESAALAQS